MLNIRLVSLIRKEFIQIWRDPRTLALILWRCWIWIAARRLRLWVYGVADRQRSAAVLEMVGLNEQANLMASELSVGWRQRLALGTAVVHRPQLLFLDEPTSGVDPLARRAFWNLIYELVAGGVTALVTTHYMDEAEYCGRVGIMNRGRLLAYGTPAELKRSVLAGTAWDLTVEPILDGMRMLERVAPSLEDVFLTLAEKQ